MPTSRDRGALSTARMLEDEFRELFGDLAAGGSTDDESAVSRAVIADPKPRVGLALSGGGIRSATFALGVLQGLARLGLLDRIHYLSTVSGGGYIGAWLTAWIHRHEAGIDGVARDLVGCRQGNGHEPAPVVHLRRYSNYLTPRTGLLSADTWTIAGIYLRNLLVNWVALLPALALPLVLPFLAFDIRRLAVDMPSWAWHAIVWGLGALPLVISVAVFGASLPSSGRAVAGSLQRRFQALTQEQFLVRALLPLVISAAAFALCWSTYRELWSGHVHAWRFAALGATLHLVALIIYVIVLRRRREDRSRELARRQAWVPWDIVAAVLSGALGGWLMWQFAERVLPWLYVLAPDLAMSTYVATAVPLFLAAFLLAAVAYVAIASRFTTEQDREWHARAGAWVLVVGVAWLALATLALIGPELVRRLWAEWSAQLVSVGGMSGLVSIWLGRGGLTSRDQDAEKPAGMTARAARWALKLAAPVFLLSIVLLLASAIGAGREAIAQALHGAATLPAGMPDLGPTPRDYLGGTLAIGAGLIAVVMLTAWAVNLNVFSLHGLYRDRLVRAFLGASRTRRDPNRFTGFDEDDNLPLLHLAPVFFSAKDWVWLEQAIRQLTRSPGSALGEVLGRSLIDEVDRAAAAGTVPTPLRERAIRAFNNLLLTADVESLVGAPSPLAGMPSIDPVATMSGPHRPDDVVWRRRAALSTWFPELGWRGSGEPRLFPIVNTAVNLVAGGELAWQERKADSFTFTPLHAGSPSVSYRRMWSDATPSECYGGVNGVSLGTAVTISGAAANPNMGYHSSPIVTVLLTLFNARLGAWIGNPGNERTWSHGYPRGLSLPLLKEAAGLTTSTDRYVHLSDGGHFENLGLYELVCRGCRFIIVSDAGCDERYEFEDLGNAVRKIRVDLGIDITFDRFYVGANGGATTPEGATGANGMQAGPKYVAIGTIWYDRRVPGAPRGQLLYLKPSICGDEPADVRNYHRAHPHYPHESTRDQWFSESQFESYRALGEHIIATIGRRPAPAEVAGIERFFQQAKAYVAGSN